MRARAALLHPLALSFLLGASAWAASPAGEYRLQVEGPALLGDLLQARLTVQPAAGGGWQVERSGWPRRLVGSGQARAEGAGWRLEVEFPAGAIDVLRGRGARLSASYLIDPAAGRISGQLRLTERSGRVRRLGEAGRVRSPYLLPWPGGRTHRCVQGNMGFVSHKRGGWDQHSFDFAMPVGSPVLAARAGKVIKVDVTHHGQGKHKPANVIYVRHADGTVASYVHLKQGGSLVSLGQQVEQGQLIGLSGNVGPSLLPHLHFMVEGLDGRSLPTWFDDVSGEGVPRSFRRYTSHNLRLP